jgi:CRISPR-associated endonuclease Csn1
MKKILGLDLGTNSIGWALVNEDLENKKSGIIGLGSRIIPMSQDVLSDFNKGVSLSQTAERTGYRGVRRLLERNLLRRERLHRVLNILDFLPKHYAKQIDFEKNFGKFIPETEPKLVYKPVINTITNKIDFEFIFKKSFEEMLSDFKTHQPNLVLGDKKVPYDWTIYYLRKKALTAKIEKEELAWLLLHFNQKRGYYQLRGEDEEETPNKLIEFHTLKVIEVTADEPQKGKTDIWYNIVLENGWIYRRASKIELFDWNGKLKEFIVTTEINDDKTIKTDKDGKEKRSFKAVNSEEDWIAIKKSTEEKIAKSKQTVGTYIYDTLLQNPNQKIKGKLVRTIERKFYKEELKQILSKQLELHTELQDKKLYNACINELYENNNAHRGNIENRDFTYLFLEDVIFYQRPLKSKKSLISNCSFESRFYLKNGKTEKQSIKCISKSHPLFQEFRLWQFVQNIKIYEKEKIVDGKLRNDVDVTLEFLKCEDDVVALFDWLNERKDVEQKSFLKYPVFNLKKDSEKYRWNFVEDKPYPCNETHNAIVNRLSKIENVPTDFLTKQKELELWHILYSVEDKIEIEAALKTFGIKNNLPENFAEVFKKIKPFDKDYGSYSEKAIKKLLPLMRMGKYWSEDAIHSQTKNRIEKIINGEFDETIRNRVRDKTINLNLTDIKHFKALPLWLTSYIVYDRHSEDANAMQWKKPEDIENYLREFKQHSLRNPIVEQVITETLRVVKDIWKTFGNNAENFFTEIHIELGREMKNPADKRKSMTEKNTENENTNLRIKALLSELLNDKDIANVRPYSPSQQEILKIYEEGVLNSDTPIDDDILKISKSAQPTKSELTKYKLWLEQKYRSPYTGEIIPLNKLFTPAFEIEHIIPQSRYFDDSLSNKVICEAEVNHLKTNQTGYEFISNHKGEKVELSFGKTVTIFTIAEYEDNVKRNYAKNRGKLAKLMMEEIPESFIQRQLNDSRYISKVVKNLLSSLVREDDEQESTSKHVISNNGNITNTLKQDWGLNDVWNDIITPRFERLNELTKSTNFGEWTNKDGKKVFQTQVPLELQRGFKKKRIDHRHHALDALIIACATRNHINYLNNEYAKADKKDTRYELRNLLCDKKYNDATNKNYKWQFKKPWDNFTIQAKEALSTTVISFKQNLRVINKTVNYYQKWVPDNNGELKKGIVKQEGKNWAIRKPMHKETVSGLISLKKIKKGVQLTTAIDNVDMIVEKDLKQKMKQLIAENYDKKKIQAYFKNLDNKWNDLDISKVDLYYLETDNVASRTKLDESFTSKIIQESITDTGIQKILLKHLIKYNEQTDGKSIEHPELAFSPDGIEDLNKNVIILNNGKFHHPIIKVRTYEARGNKFNVGVTGNKGDKYVEAAKGTNLFFAIYKDDNGKRNYETIPLNIVIENQKQGALQNIKPEHCSVPNKNEKGDHLLFHLSPNDLVYVPTIEEIENKNSVDFNHLTKEQINRIYKFIDGSDTIGNFIPHHSSKLLFNMTKKDQDKANINFIIQNEYGVGSPQSKSQKSIDGIMIKDICWKLTIDRLGKIKHVLK